MRKLMLLLGFLTFYFACPALYAQEISQKIANSEITKASLLSSDPESDEYDAAGARLAIYSLIAGIYALYWFKQKA